jgi:hypothetical protein
MNSRQNLGFSAISGLGSIIKSALTAPDGESWAPGRIMGFVVFTVGQCLVVRASHQQLAHANMDPNGWASFFQAVSMFEAAISTIAIGLVLGMAPADPGGKWWGREASPPPPPTR